MAASFPMLIFGVNLLFSKRPENWFFVLSIVHALYGGFAGMLMQRFAIDRAFGFAAIPAILLTFVVATFSGFPLGLILITTLLLVPAYLFARLAFWYLKVASAGR